MGLIAIFLIAFLFSFIGSIPPGTLNVTVLWMALDEKMNLAVRFSAAAAIVEYPYGWIALRFADIITANSYISQNLKLISGCAMIIFGCLSLSSGKSTGDFRKRLDSSGFRKGLLLGILNPMAIPFWIGVTAYLESLHWIVLKDTLTVQAYLFGICAGAFALLMLVALTAKRLFSNVSDSKLLRKVPGLTLISLGSYALFTLFAENF